LEDQKGGRIAGQLWIMQWVVTSGGLVMMALRIIDAGPLDAASRVNYDYIMFRHCGSVRKTLKVSRK
jgi:hypothetical protein